MAQPSGIERLYRDGVAAIRAGDTTAGREKLRAVVEANPFHEQAWLWLSAAALNDEERIICLENVLTINPHNETARRGLKQLRAPLPPEPPSRAAPPSPGSGPESEPEPDAVPRTGPPAPLAEARRLEHAAPEALDPYLRSLVTGTPQEAPPPIAASDETWRAELYDPEHLISTATLAPSMEPPPRLSIRHLMGVWGGLLALNAGGRFHDEIKHGGFKHIFLSIAAAGIFQVAGAALLLLMTALLLGRGVHPPLFASLEELAGQVSGASIELDPAEGIFGNTIFALEQLGVVRSPEWSVTITPPGSSPWLRAVRSSLSLAALGLIYLVLAIPLLFVGQMVYAVFTNFVSTAMLQGKGDVFKTLQALALALAAGQIVQLPFTPLLLFLPVGIAAVIGTLLWLYQLLITAVSLGAVQRFGILLSIGALLMSSAAVGLVGGGLVFLASWLLALLA